jgi:hypothetical protein
MRLILALLSAFVLISVAAASPAPELVDFFSFEQDFEGWTAEGVGPTSVSRSQDRATDGQTSIKLSLLAEGEVPKCAAWIQRGFALTPNQTYQVQVRYSFATLDSDGAVISFPTVIIAGVPAGPLAALPDVFSFVHESAFNQRNSGRYRWLGKQYEFTAGIGDAGVVPVIIGVLGVAGSYYVDSVRVKFTRRQAGAAEPVISSAARVGKKLVITGSAFGPSPRVLIADVDRTDSVTISSPDRIELKHALDGLGLRFVAPALQVVVVDDTTAAASAPFTLTATN